MNVVHAGLDGLRLTIDTDIPAELRAALAQAKHEAAGRHGSVAIDYNGLSLHVRASGGASGFSAATGETEVEWYFRDPENKPADRAGVTVDFRALLLATGGLDTAQEVFHRRMNALGIRYEDHLIKVSRVDFAVDVLAPWFEPDRRCVIAASRTKSTDQAALEVNENGVGVDVHGIRVGHISNRQLVIYDKRREIIDTSKPVWREIWNAQLRRVGFPDLDLAVPAKSQVWRFELRLGSKHLRNRWELRGWHGLEARLGDAIVDAFAKFRYVDPANDTNRARWPVTPIWQLVTEEVARYFEGKRSFAEPTLVREVCRAAHVDRCHTMITGYLLSLAAACGVDEDGLNDFFRRALRETFERAKDHPIPIEERLHTAKSRYKFT